MITLFKNSCIWYPIPCCSEFPCYRKSLNELVTAYVPTSTLEKITTPGTLEKSCTFQGKTNKKPCNRNSFPLLLFSLYVAKEKLSTFLNIWYT